MLFPWSTGKVRVFPDTVYIYNKCVVLCKAYWADGSKFPDLSGLHHLFANASLTLVADQPWLDTDTPLQVRTLAMEEFWTARSVNIKVVKEKPLALLRHTRSDVHHDLLRGPRHSSRESTTAHMGAHPERQQVTVGPMALGEELRAHRSTGVHPQVDVESTRALRHLPCGSQDQ